MEWKVNESKLQLWQWYSSKVAKVHKTICTKSICFIYDKYVDFFIYICTFKYVTYLHYIYIYAFYPKQHCIQGVQNYLHFNHKYARRNS